MISLVALIVIVFLVFLSIFICAVCLDATTQNAHTKFKGLFKYETPPIFYSNHHNNINIENKYDCSLERLRVCDVDNPINIMGCKEFAVRCFHFDNDISYFDDGEVAMRIPKNNSPREGYVLAIKDLATSCNPYHGDLVLISSGLRNNEYLLICNCKKPGYIGNDTLLGSCESVHICNGKVDDINKPLDQIKCLCEKAEMSKKIHESEVPVCVPITVREANDTYNDWSSLVQWGNRDTISTEALSLDYKINLPDRILDPCRNSIIDTSVSIPNGQYDKDIGSCRFHDYGIPFSIGLFPQSKKNHNSSVLDCAVHTKLPYQFVRVTGKVDGNESVLAINVDAKTVVVLPDEKNRSVGVGESAQIMITTKPKVFFAPTCDAIETKLTYVCYVGEHYDLIENGLPRAQTEPHPFFYIWGYEDWDKYETIAGNNSLDYSKREGLRITDPKNFLLGGDRVAAYGIKFGREESGVLSFQNIEDYRIHEQASF